MRGILIAAFALGLAGAAGAGTKFANGPSGGLTLIDGPGTTARTVDRVKNGTRVQELETYGGYSLVRLPNGFTAWVKGNHLSRSAPVAKPAAVADAAPAQASETPALGADAETFTSVVWPKAGNLNMRSGPGTNYEVLGTIQRGDWVEVFEKVGVWRHVRLASGDTGWAHGSYMTR